MAHNFIECDREQAFLMPPSLRDWLPDDHLAWFIPASAEELDLSGFYVAYRDDGHGRPAHDPQMMVALLLYAYAKGERSSRGIERGCTEDIAYRVISANQRPDHTTIARFRQRHEVALAELFSDVLRLCAEAGLLKTGVVAIDGTKIHANAAHHSNRDYEQIARDVLAEAARPIVARTSSTASAAATSCRRSWRRTRAGAAGCARPVGGSTSSAHRKRSRSRARAPSGCAKRSTGSRRSSRQRVGQTQPMRPTASAA